jgi:hypothetical protein
MLVNQRRLSAISVVICVILASMPALVDAYKLSLHHLVNTADLICSGIVVDKTVHSTRSKPKGITYAVKLEYIFLTHLKNIQLSRQIEVNLPLTTHNLSEIAVGRKYIFFLTLNGHAFNIVLGEEGAFEIESESNTILNLHGFFVGESRDGELFVGGRHPRYGTGKRMREMAPTGYIFTKNGELIKTVHPDDVSDHEDSSEYLKADSFIDVVIKLRDQR